MNTKHTPTPWKISDDKHRAIVNINGNGLVVGLNRLRDDDAKFIVKAVNCHEELLEALKALVYDVEYYDTGKPTKNGFNLAKQAIAKAGGEI